MRVYLAESGGVFRAYLSKEGFAKMSINGTGGEKYNPTGYKGGTRKANANISRRNRTHRSGCQGC